MKKNICVLTQPLQNNYGGLLQAFALQKILKQLGHDVVTDIRPHSPVSTFAKLKSSAKFFLLKNIPCIQIADKYPYYQFLKDTACISVNTRKFIDRHISIIDLFEGGTTVSEDKIHQFDAFIIGSDQVWRPCYSPFLPNYFLNFIAGDKSKVKLAYAASFGVSEWEFSSTDTELVKGWLREFDAISVREDSAVELCRTRLKAEATQVLDPTLLLDKSAYVSLIEQDAIGKSEGSIMTYMLDQTDDKQMVIDRVVSKLGLKAFKVMPELKLNSQNRKQLDKCIYPKVTEWLRGFMDAEFIVTDSFHGTVFSIIFNKPFISIANEDRGITRFTSLLNLLNLEERLIYSSNGLTDDLIRGIDYSKVNTLLDKERARSLAFLANSLM